MLAVLFVLGIKALLVKMKIFFLCGLFWYCVDIVNADDVMMFRGSCRIGFCHFFTPQICSDEMFAYADFYFSSKGAHKYALVFYIKNRVKSNLLMFIWNRYQFVIRLYHNLFLRIMLPVSSGRLYSVWQKLSRETMKPVKMIPKPVLDIVSLTCCSVCISWWLSWSVKCSFVTNVLSSYLFLMLFKCLQAARLKWHIDVRKPKGSL